MNVAKQLPDVLICSPITEKRIVVQIDFLLPNLYEHLHCNMLKSTNEPLTDILQVVVAEYQIDLTVKPIQYLYPFGSTAQAEITQVEYRITGSYDTVPISLKGRLQKPMIFAWLKCVSDVKNVCSALNLKFIVTFLLFTSPHPRWSAESWLLTLFYDIGLTHVDLLHKGSTELVEFLVQKFLLALFKCSIQVAMLLEEVFEHIL